MAENGNRALVLRGGYRQKHPPDDDCCPICFGDFEVPCRTNCGHWYCGSCFLRLWRYTKDIKPCKCPMCDSKVTELVPDATRSSLLGREGRKVIKGIKEYNFLNIENGFGIFLKALTVPSMTWRRLRWSLDTMIDAPLCRFMHVMIITWATGQRLHWSCHLMRIISAYLVIAYNVYSAFRILPGIMTVAYCVTGVIPFLHFVLIDTAALWYRWKHGMLYAWEDILHPQGLNCLMEASFLTYHFMITF